MHAETAGMRVEAQWSEEQIWVVVECPHSSSANAPLLKVEEAEQFFFCRHLFCHFHLHHLSWEERRDGGLAIAWNWNWNRNWGFKRVHWLCIPARVKLRSSQKAGSHLRRQGRI